MSQATPQREKVTRATVARHANVSTAVVSYVLNDGPRPVAASTRERVLKAVQELGYRPNAIARALKLRRTKTVGLIVPDNSNPYFAELAKAIEDAAYARGYALILGNSSNDPQREAAQLRTLSERQVDGLLIISASAHPDLTVFRDDGIPLVLLDRAGHSLDYPSVVVDNIAGTAEGVEHLIQHGHSRIGCLAGPKDVPAAIERETGWRKTLKRHKLPTSRLLVRSEFTRHGGYDGMRKLLHQNPTAIFASSDLQGVGALRAANEAGLNVPRDLALLTFDGTQESEFTTPPLSVVRQPITQIATEAVNLMLSGEKSRRNEQRVLIHELKLRQSCGCPTTSR